MSDRADGGQPGDPNERADARTRPNPRRPHALPGGENASQADSISIEPVEAEDGTTYEPIPPPPSTTGCQPPLVRPRDPGVEDFPAASVPGQPPAPLPGQRGNELASPHVSDEAEHDAGLLLPIRTMMSAHAPDGWSAAGELILTAPSPRIPRADQIPAGYDGEVMVLPDGGGVLVDSPRVSVHARRVRRHSLEPAPPGTTLLSHLRALHTRTAPNGIVPLAAEWRRVSGVEGVLDLFARPGDREASFFQFSAAFDAEEGLYVSGEPSLGGLLASEVVIDDLADSGFSWSHPQGWSTVELLQFSSPTLTAFAQLEQTYSESSDRWRAVVFQRGPFLRGAKPLGDREVVLHGFGPLQLERFDWQPPGRGRLITSIAHGVADGRGFSFALHVDLDTPGLFTTDAQPLLDSIGVRSSREIQY